MSQDEGSQVREFLRRAVNALTGLAEGCTKVVAEEGLEPAEKHQAFISVLERDAQESLAALERVLAQPAISSQLIDNRNASIHLRALLTDLFLVGEILTTQPKPGQAVTPEIKAESFPLERSRLLQGIFHSRPALYG